MLCESVLVWKSALHDTTKGHAVCQQKPCPSKRGLGWIPIYFYFVFVWFSFFFFLLYFLFMFLRWYLTMKPWLAQNLLCSWGFGLTETCLPLPSEWFSKGVHHHVQLTFVFKERVLLCSLGWPPSRNSPFPVSKMLEWQICVTISCAQHKSPFFCFPGYHELNLGPDACQSSTGALTYIPNPYFIFSPWDNVSISCPVQDGLNFTL